MKGRRVKGRTSRADRAVRATVHGHELLLPASHRLPEYAKKFPDYSTNLARLAAAVDADQPGAPVIDIGANVGDSAVLLRDVTAAPLLCVEGDPFWLDYLTYNTGDLRDVEVELAYLGATDGAQALELARVGGTGALRPAAGGSTVRTLSPGSLLERHPRFAAARLVKSDTDGFDVGIVTAIVAGGQLPGAVLFFEYDPGMTRAAGDEPLDLWPVLREAGYASALWWDNFGNYLMRSGLDDTTVRGLTSYVPATGGAYYWDVAVLHGDDTDLARRLDAAEQDRVHR